MTLTIGLTGGIASGKSTVAEMLEKRDALISDADELSHQVIAAGSEGFDEVVEEFGEEIVNDAGEINRSKLAEMVFHEPERLRALESIVHPRVLERQREVIERGEEEDRPVVLMIPLLFENDLDELCDVTWTVSCDDELKFDRLEERGLTRSQAKDRLAQQMPDSDKQVRADFVLYNNGTLEELEQQVDWCWQRTLDTAADNEQISS